MDVTIEDIALWPDISVASLAVATGCDRLLTTGEQTSLAGCIPAVRRQAAAARIAARSLLSDYGHGAWSLPRRTGNAPVWPDGVVGSLSHSNNYGVAAVAPETAWAGIGIDVEPATPLEPDLVRAIATAAEISDFGDDGLMAHVLFSIKEAAYKAAYPLDRRFLEAREMQVCLKRKVARTCYGRHVPFTYRTDHRIVAVAAIAR